MIKANFNLKRVRALIKESGIDALIASTPEDFAYVSGFYHKHILFGERFPQFVIIPKEETLEPVLITMNLAAEQARRASWIKDQRTYADQVHIERPKEISAYASDPYKAVAKVLKERGIAGDIGIREKNISVYMFKRFRKLIPYAKFKDSGDIFDELRMIKSEGEIRKIKRAVKITEKALEVAMETISEGVTELDVIRKFRRVVVDEGANFSHILMSAGARSGHPYNNPTDYKMKKGDIVRFDVGAMYRGYRADVFRQGVIGEPTERLKKLYSVLLEGQRRAVEAIRPGVKIAEIFKIGITAIKKEYPQYRRKSIGHSIGLEIEEPPFVTSRNQKLLKRNMVLAIEVPYYVVGWGQASVEDNVLVTEDGHEELSTLSRELRIL